jgi:hypothetical protein
MCLLASWMTPSDRRDRLPASCLSAGCSSSVRRRCCCPYRRKSSKQTKGRTGRSRSCIPAGRSVTYRVRSKWYCCDPYIVIWTPAAEMGAKHEVVAVLFENRWRFDVVGPQVSGLGDVEVVRAQCIDAQTIGSLILVSHVASLFQWGR